ncbi:MAG: hypothetical protein U0136_18070 [Bdellovibrionota bacterium]
MRFRNLLHTSRFPLFALLAAVGCGPVYDTQYQFVPPENASGRSCIFQCENSRQQCRQLEDYRVEDCERHSDYEKDRCEEDLYRRKGRDPKWYECTGESCTADYDRCDETYRSCYQSCGGEVHAETRCVANCDKIPPGQR